MRLRVAFGVLALAAGSFVACGDDGEDSNAAGGTGGAAGASAVAGTGGSVGGSAGDAGSPAAGPGSGGCGVSPVSPLCGGPSTGGTTNTASDAGTSTDAGDAGVSDASDAPSQPCTGCLELRATVTNNEDSAFFQIVYDTPVDMSAAGATITFRVSGLAPESQVRVAPFANDFPDYTYAPGESTELTAADGFVDIVLELDEITNGDFDESNVLYVGLFVGYTGGIGAESSRDLALLLDSVTFSGADTPDLAFTTDNESFERSEIGVQATEIVHR